MKISKRIAAALLSVLAICLCLPVRVMAEGSIDLTHETSLTISYREGNIPLAGAEFSIYLVATVDEYGVWTAASDFDQFHVNLQPDDEETWRTLAFTLEGYVLRDKLVPTDSGKTDAEGFLTFPTTQQRLHPGLYLIIGYRHIQDGCIYDASPCMVMLPGMDKETNDWNYHVTAVPKHGSELIPDESDTITRKVIKIWKDEGHEEERPKEVIVQLLRDGAVYETVTLKEDNLWKFTWTDLDSSYQWTIVEKELENYTVEISREGVTYVITNTYIDDVPETQPIEPSTPDEPDQPVLPQTGQLWWPVPVLFAVGMLLVIVGLIRRRSDAE